MPMDKTKLLDTELGHLLIPPKQTRDKFQFIVSAATITELLLRRGRFDKIEIPRNHELLPQLEEYCRLGGYLFIQTKEFNGTPLKNPYVWHRGEWEIAYDKWKADKYNSERGYQLAELELREIMKISLRLPPYFGQHALHIARELWEKKDHSAAKGLNVDMSDIKFIEELNDEVDALMPVLKQLGITAY